MTALALVTTDNLPAQITSDRFVPNGLDPIIEAIKKEALSFAPDISTKAGRSDIASLAHKVAKSKTAIDKAGKDLVSGIKAQAKIIDTERSRAWDILETLQKEVRRPLTEWEERDEKRIAEREAALAEMGNLIAIYDGPNNSSVEELEKKMARLQEIGKSLDWEEFAVRAQELHKTVYDTLLVRLEARRKHVSEQDELLKLRKEAEERARKDREAQIAAEAAAKAQAEAEAKAKQEAEAEARKVALERQRAEDERQKIEGEKQAAEDRAKKAEADAIAAAEKSERDRIAAEAKAKRDAEIAVENERKRAEEVKRQEAETAAKREADKKHRTKINNEALNAMVATIGAGNPDHEEICRHIIEAIAKSQIPHVRISY